MAELIEATFHRASEHQEGRESLTRVNKVLEIIPRGKTPIYVVVQDGKYRLATTRPTTNGPKDILPIESSEETLIEVFSARTKIAEAAFEKHDFIAPLYGDQSYVTAWLAKIIRIGNRKPLFDHKY